MKQQAGRRSVRQNGDALRKTKISKYKHNMKKTIIIATLIAAGSLIGYAQPSGGPPRGAGPMDPVMKALDSDTNNVISAAEITGAPAALLKLDKDGDGKLSADELAPQLPNGAAMPTGGRKPPVTPVMKALDADSDGALSKEEINNAPTTLKTLDKNSDGELSRDEVLPQRPGGGRGGPGRNQQ